MPPNPTTALVVVVVLVVFVVVVVAVVAALPLKLNVGNWKDAPETKFKLMLNKITKLFKSRIKA